MNLKGIGNAASNARKQQKLTQKKAADKCGISLRHYSAVERGEGETSIKTFNKIAKGLGIQFSLDFPTSIIIVVLSCFIYWYL